MHCNKKEVPLREVGLVQALWLNFRSRNWKKATKEMFHHKSIGNKKFESSTAKSTAT
jgi:hypothetical protein